MAGMSTYQTIRTRVSPEVYAALCTEVEDSSTLAALVRDILVQHVAPESRLDGRGIPESGCECHDPTHVLCWAVAPNPDCHCCDHTLRMIEAQRAQRDSATVAPEIKRVLPEPTDDQWRRLNQWMDATGKAPGADLVITTRGGMLAWAASEGFQP